MNFNLSLAALPGLQPAHAMGIALHQGVEEPLLGRLSLDHVQLVPQSRGMLDEALVDELLDAHPDTRFRCHANTRCLPERHVLDLCDFDPSHPYWKQLASISKRLCAKGYTAHAGRRDRSSLAQAFDNTLRASDLFGCPVGIEGHYPTPKGNPWLLADWAEYAALLASRIPYALDLSHLHIVQHLSRSREDNLVRELLASDACMEVHVSGNSGRSDAHQPLTEAPWWWELLAYANPSAVVFSEGQHDHH